MSDQDKRADMLAGVSDEALTAMSHSTGLFIRSADSELNKAKLRRLAEERAPDPSIFETREPWFGRAVASTYTIDSYYTRPDKQTTLRNYEADLSEGRALLIGHETRGTINLGMSLLGKYEAHGYTQRDADGKEEAVPWVYGDFYLMQGKEPQDSTIEAFRGGTQDRFSVGFQPGWWRCSVCERDLFDWDCSHIPGRFYDKKGAAADDRSAEGAMMAWADLVDMRLRELSTVYANASPGATLLKAQRMVESGSVHEWKTVRLLEQIYRHRMPGTDRVYPAGQPVEREAAQVADEGKENPPANAVAEQVTGIELGLVIDRAELVALGLTSDATPSVFIEAFKTHRANAQQVETYRSAAIDDAMEDFKRATGQDYTEDSDKRQRKMLAALDIADITAQRREWSDRAAKLFGTGRQTVEKPNEEPAATTAAADRRDNGRQAIPGGLGRYTS